MIERSSAMVDTRLPGHDAHQSVNLRPAPHQAPFTGSSESYEGLTYHREYLKNQAYHKYLRMHKVFVGESGARKLVEIGDQLASEELPHYLDAAGWAYAEAGLVLANESAVSRVELIKAAEDCWRQSLQNQQYLLDDRAPAGLYEEAGSHRTAMNLAYAPLMKAVTVGNVTASVRERAFADTLAITQLNSLQLRFAAKEHDREAVAAHVGFAHEANAMLTLLGLNDPRYIPLPSSARADTGYYHQNQTHDITVINQHWGDIKKVIPLEIKAKASARDRERYKALIVRGKMHLSVAGSNDPTRTTEAFSNVYNNTANPEDIHIVDHASSAVLNLLKLYQRGASNAVENVTSRTKFHDARYVAPHYRHSSR